MFRSLEDNDPLVTTLERPLNRKAILEIKIDDTLVGTRFW